MKHTYPAGSRLLKVHENARTSILIFKNFPGVTPPDPRNEGRGGEREGRGGGDIGHSTLKNVAPPLIMN
jgi:hypothetical protein